MAELEKFRSDFGFMAKSFREMSIHVVFYLDEMIAQIKFKRSLLTKRTMKFNDNKPAVVIALPPASIQDRIHTMKIAIISDIHGNYEALLSVKVDIQKAQVDKIICLGDFIGYGPQPEEVAKYLIENEIPCVMGNHEKAIINPAALISFSSDAMLSIESQGTNFE
jgi:fructose-1,6-bisphosphatase